MCFIMIWCYVYDLVIYLFHIRKNYGMLSGISVNLMVIHLVLLNVVLNYLVGTCVKESALAGKY